VKVVFADTFYWIALSLPGDAASARAGQIADDIVTTEEVLTEYLTFFCASPEHLRREAASNVEAILRDPTVRVVPQTHDSFVAGFELYRARPDTRVQPGRLYFDADHAQGRADRGSHQ
jgi:hypothetical protein